MSIRIVLGLAVAHGANLAEARELAAKLLAKPAEPLPEPGKGAEAKLFRDQLLVLLMGNVSKVRTAAARVFKDHPEILRQVTSAYVRRRRAEYRARQKAKSEEE